MLALSYEERQQFTHHSIHMSLARRSSHRSPASKNVQGEYLPISKGKVLLYFPPRPPLPTSLVSLGKSQVTLALLMAGCLQSCPVSPAPSSGRNGTLPHSQAARGKTEVAPKWKSTEKSYLQSGLDLQVGQGYPVKKAQGFQARVLRARHQHRQKLGFIQRSVREGREGKPLLETAHISEGWHPFQLWGYLLALWVLEQHRSCSKEGRWERKELQHLLRHNRTVLYLWACFTRWASGSRFTSWARITLEEKRRRTECFPVEADGVAAAV